MEYVNLGRTGLKVSRFCLGTMNFGPHSNEATSFDIMDNALEFGINFLDTANVYGWKRGEWITENIIGRWLAQGGGRRDQIILATKVYGSMGEGPNDRRLSAYHVRRACDESLKRLQTDHIDIFQMHHVDRETPFEEIWQAMEVLINQGKVLYVGSSNFAGWQIAQAQCIAKERHFMGLISEQSLYNLDDRQVELEVIPACRAFGLGLIPYSPLGGGLLAGLAQKIKEGRRASEHMQTEFEKKQNQIRSYETYCRELGEEPAIIALAWLLNNPVVTAPIIGPRTKAQLKNSLKAIKILLTDEQMVRLNEIWPGPGGEAPEAYAW